MPENSHTTVASAETWSTVSSILFIGGSYSPCIKIRVNIVQQVEIMAVKPVL